MGEIPTTQFMTGFNSPLGLNVSVVGGDILAHNTFDFQEDYDDYIENTPIVARFDYLTIQTLITEGIEKHEAYEMPLAEYVHNRDRFAECDETEKRRLSFYLPQFPSMISSDLASSFDLSHHKFMIMIIELGLIIFKYDYNAQYTIITEGRKELPKKLTNDTRRIHYLQLDKQSISLGTCTNVRSNSTKHYAPNVRGWLYNAISNQANYLNMSMSDVVYLSWCFGVTRNLEEGAIPPVLANDISNILYQFDTELDIYCNRIKQVTSDINACY